MPRGRAEGRMLTLVPGPEGGKTLLISAGFALVVNPPPGYGRHAVCWPFPRRRWPGRHRRGARLAAQPDRAAR